MTTTVHEATSDVAVNADRRPSNDGRDSRRKVKGRLGPGRRIPFIRAIGPLLVLAFWSIASATGWLDPTVLPSPVAVVRAANRLAQDGTLTNSIGVSLRRAMLGLGIGIGVGTTLALLAGLTRAGTALIDGTVQLWRSVPILAVIPIAVVWIGIGEQMKVIIIALAVMIPIYINTASALSAIDQRYVELSHALRLTRWSFIRYIALPGALPGFFVGLRLAAVSCWLVLVVVEQTNATSGIGFFMTNAQQFGQVDILTVGLVLYALFGLVSDTLVLMLERRVLSWRKSLGR
jgi:sulfonate transport system permease protein